MKLLADGGGMTPVICRDRLKNLSRFRFRLQGPGCCPLIGLKPRLLLAYRTGHNTLWRYLCIKGIGNGPMFRKCVTEEENSVHILCECEALASLRYIYLGSFFLDPDDINLLTPNVNYSGRTAPLTSKVAFYIFIQQI